MSHFTVTVCLDGKDEHLSRVLAVASDGFPLRKLIEAHLDSVLAPFDENRETEPYRDYEEGGPESYWLVQSIRRGAEILAAERIGRYSSRARDMTVGVDAVREQAPGWAGDSALDRELGANPTWADVARVYNGKYGDDGAPLLISEDGRAYTMSTRNPQAKWDWWAIGGRWAGYFPYKKDHDCEVIPAEPHWSSDNKPIPAGHCDGGPLRALDLARLRKEKADGARKTWAEYQAVVAGTPEALPWPVFTDNISEGTGYDIGQARTEYSSQPRIEALNNHEDFRWHNADDFTCGEKLYTERARAAAVPGWATLTTDGRWMEQGSMGWFAMTDATDGSKIGYWEAANAYIGSLPDDAWLVTVDAHI